MDTEAPVHLQMDKQTICDMHKSHICDLSVKRCATQDAKMRAFCVTLATLNIDLSLKRPRG